MTANQQLRTIEVLNFSAIRVLSRRLARQIQTDRFCPEIVIAIARGGFVPARLLCDYLNLFNLACIRITHYTGTDKNEKPRLSIPLNIDIRGKTVLLVDDVDDSGETLQLALTHLHSFHPAMIRSAVLHHKTVSSVVPEYFAEEIIQWRWITYPWAITEDVLSLISKAQPMPESIEEAILYMAKIHDLRISKATMTDVYRLLA